MAQLPGVKAPTVAGFTAHRQGRGEMRIAGTWDEGWVPVALGAAGYPFEQSASRSGWHRRQRASGLGGWQKKSLEHVGAPPLLLPHSQQQQGRLLTCRTSGHRCLRYPKPNSWSEPLRPLSTQVEILMPNLTMLGGGTFGRGLGHEGISALHERDPRESSHPFCQGS